MGKHDQRTDGRPGNRKEINTGRINLRQTTHQHPQLTNRKTHQSTTEKRQQLSQLEPPRTTPTA